MTGHNTPEARKLLERIIANDRANWSQPSNSGAIHNHKLENEYEKLTGRNCPEWPRRIVPVDCFEAAHQSPEGAETGARPRSKGIDQMKDYAKMTGAERFKEVSENATQLFDTDRWKTALSRLYGITPQAVNKWSHEGAPIWAAVATRDALAAHTLQNVVKAIRNAT